MVGLRLQFPAGPPMQAMNLVRFATEIHSTPVAYCYSMLYSRDMSKPWLIFMSYYLCGSRGSNVGQSVTWSTTLLQSDVSQNLIDR